MRTSGSGQPLPYQLPLRANIADRLFVHSIMSRLDHRSSPRWRPPPWLPPLSKSKHACIDYSICFPFDLIIDIICCPGDRIPLVPCEPITAGHCARCLFVFAQYLLQLQRLPPLAAANCCNLVKLLSVCSSPRWAHLTSYSVGLVGSSSISYSLLETKYKPCFTLRRGIIRLRCNHAENLHWKLKYDLSSILTMLYGYIFLPNINYYWYLCTLLIWNVSIVYIF